VSTHRWQWAGCVGCRARLGQSLSGEPGGRSDAWLSTFKAKRQAPLVASGPLFLFLFLFHYSIILGFLQRAKSPPTPTRRGRPAVNRACCRRTALEQPLLGVPPPAGQRPTAHMTHVIWVLSTLNTHCPLQYVSACARVVGACECMCVRVRACVRVRVCACECV
jgi:hypothetical protein